MERDWSQDNIYHLDVAGWRADLVAARGFSRDLSVVIRIPWISIGPPHWDAFPEKVHEVLGVSSLQREVFPRGDTFIYLKDRHNRHIIEGREELNGAGLGDLAIALSSPLPRRWGAYQRLVVSVEAPTGRQESLHGSGGWDMGIGWFARWERNVRTYKVAAGYSHLDRGGSFFTYRRADVWHLLAELDRPFGQRLKGTAGVRMDSSPLAAVIGGYAGHPPTYYRFGIAGDLAGQGWFAFDVGQELIPQTGIEADWSVHLTAGHRLGAAALTPRRPYSAGTVPAPRRSLR